MSATTTDPAASSPGGSIRGSFGAPNVTVSEASTTGPIGAGSSADSPLGRSTATTGTAPALRSWTIVSRETLEGRLEAGAEQGIDDNVPPQHLGAVQLPVLGGPDLDHVEPEAAENVEIQPRVAADAGCVPEEVDLDVDAGLPEHARHDEPVAAVVAAAGEHRHARLGQPVERGFHGRHHLPAGVLHQHRRRHADVLDGPAVGFAHLVAVHYAHGQAPGAASGLAAGGLRALYHKRYRYRSGVAGPRPASLGRLPACPQWHM